MEIWLFVAIRTPESDIWTLYGPLVAWYWHYPEFPGKLVKKNSYLPRSRRGIVTISWSFLPCTQIFSIFPTFWTIVIRLPTRTFFLAQNLSSFGSGLCHHKTAEHYFPTCLHASLCPFWFVCVVNTWVKPFPRLSIIFPLRPWCPVYEYVYLYFIERSRDDAVILWASLAVRAVRYHTLIT